MLDNFKEEADIICQMLGYKSALDANMSYVVSQPEANYFGERWIFNELDCSLETEIDSIFDCKHNGEWEGKCTTDQIAGVKCHQGSLF